MLIMVAIIFCVIVSSLSWVPEQSQNRNLPDYFSERERDHSKHLLQSSSVGGQVVHNHVFQQEDPEILAHQEPSVETVIKSDKNPWDGLPLAKDDIGDEPVDNFADSKKEPDYDADIIDDKVQPKGTTLAPSSSSAVPSIKLDLKVRI